MKLAIIGDLHGFWDEKDTAYFNASSYDALLFVGDLPRRSGGMREARELARLTRPTWVMPGNHDGVTLPQLLAEISGWRTAASVLGTGMARRVRRLERAMAPAHLGGYTLDTLAPGLGLLTARPHAMGPDRFYYRRYLRTRHGVDDFAASAERLKELVDRAPSRLLILAHNGPAGLGAAPYAPFGDDFSQQGGDFGDPDLRAAITHANATGKRVLAVIAGHMHHHNPRTGAVRRTWVHEGGTLYLNVARVPRMHRDGSHRHHVALEIDGDSVRATVVFVDALGRLESLTALGPQEGVSGQGNSG